MASMKLSFSFVLLISSAAGLVALGEAGRGGGTACAVQCFQGGYITCDNYPGKQLDGCDCICAPNNGRNCVLHLLSSGDSYNCPPHA